MRLLGKETVSLFAKTGIDGACMFICLIVQILNFYLSPISGIRDIDGVFKGLLTRLSMDASNRLSFGANISEALCSS